jgi:broad specificity phosphatase PhoE
MKSLEIRRHTMRIIPGQHLSQAGVTLARRLGGAMGPFDRVVTSTLPRAYETAIAMGFAVDAQDEIINSYGQDVEAELPWPQAFVSYLEASRKGGAVTGYIKRLSRFYHELLDSVPEGGSALVVNHGGVVEMSSVACYLQADYELFGGPVDYCEGVRLFWEQDRFGRAEILRV